MTKAAKNRAIPGRRQIEVVADWQEIGQPSRLGSLFATQLRGKESFEFHYDSDWLKSACCGQLDPDLLQFSGPQYPNSKANFGLFLDSSPDRWGRFLQDRRETLSAAQEGRERRNCYTPMGPATWS